MASLLHFRIQIANISRPPVWRKVAVPADYSFMDFHRIIQAVFGWEDAHLFQFSDKGYGSEFQITIPDPSGYFEPDEQRDAKDVKLSEIFKEEGQQYVYIYDFGDDWTHNITLEKVSGERVAKPMLTAGKGACPPEDCGGPGGYEGLKEVLADPKHPEAADLREWLGMEEDEAWDAAAFDLEAHQEALSEEFA